MTVSWCLVYRFSGNNGQPAWLTSSRTFKSDYHILLPSAIVFIYERDMYGHDVGQIPTVSFKTLLSVTV